MSAMPCHCHTNNWRSSDWIQLFCSSIVRVLFSQNDFKCIVDFKLKKVFSLSILTINSISLLSLIHVVSRIHMSRTTNVLTHTQIKYRENNKYVCDCSRSTSGGFAKTWITHLTHAFFGFIHYNLSSPEWEIEENNVHTILTNIHL